MNPNLSDSVTGIIAVEDHDVDVIAVGEIGPMGYSGYSGYSGSPAMPVSLPVYANNAAALSGGLVAGQFYRTGANPDPVCVVH